MFEGDDDDGGGCRGRDGNELVHCNDGVGGDGVGKRHWLSAQTLWL